MIKIDVLTKGFDSAVSRLKRNTNEKAGRIIEVSASSMVTDAKRRLKEQPVRDSSETKLLIPKVRSSIKYDFFKNDLMAEVTSGRFRYRKQAAYLEFGTGIYADRELDGMPSEIQEIARQFYVDGTGTMRTHRYFFSSFQRAEIRLYSKLQKVKLRWD